MIDGCGVAENQMIHPGWVERCTLQGRAHGVHPKLVQGDITQRFAEVAERSPRTSGKYDFGGAQEETPQGGEGRGGRKDQWRLRFGFQFTRLQQVCSPSRSPGLH